MVKEGNLQKVLNRTSLVLLLHVPKALSLDPMAWSLNEYTRTDIDSTTTTQVLAIFEDEKIKLVIK